MKKTEHGKSLLDFIIFVLIIIIALFIYLNFIKPKYSSVDPHNEIAKFEVLDTDSTTYQKYFYNQLNDNGKYIYYTILNNIETLKEGTQLIKIDINKPDVSDSFQNAWDAICLDRPEIFYIDTNKFMLESQTMTNILGQKKYSYTLKPSTGNSSYLQDTWKTKSDVNNSINQIEDLANQIVKNANGSRYNQVKYVHDYIVANTSYDNSSENVSNIYGALINKKALCEGYTETFKYLLDKLNIPNVIVYGKALKENSDPEEHSWNYVQMDDGKWYAVDCTWDDPIIIGGGKLPEKNKYTYFLKGSKTISSSHIEDNYVSSDKITKTSTYFTYPTLSENDYK